MQHCVDLSNETDDKTLENLDIKLNPDKIVVLLKKLVLEKINF